MKRFTQHLVAIRQSKLLLRTISLPRFLITALIIVIFLGLITYRLNLSINHGPDNRDCTMKYVGLEKTWLKEDPARIRKIKNLDNHDVSDYVDHQCTLERMLKQLEMGEDISLQDYLIAQQNFDQTYDKLCKYIRWWCFLYPPKQEELALWLDLMTTKPVEPVYHFSSIELSRLFELIATKRIFIIRAVFKKERILVYYQTKPRIHSEIIHSRTELHSETFTIVRICPACTPQNHWTNCPVKYTNHSIYHYGWSKYHDWSEGTIYNEYGLIVDTWRRSSYYPENY